jgi:hypothetical protein
MVQCRLGSGRIVPLTAELEDGHCRAKIRGASKRCFSNEDTYSVFRLFSVAAPGQLPLPDLSSQRSLRRQIKPAIAVSAIILPVPYTLIGLSSLAEPMSSVGQSGSI